MKSDSRKRNTHSSRWKDPVKGRSASAETLNTEGNFQTFAETMRRIVNKREEKPIPVSASRAPDVS